MFAVLGGIQKYFIIGLGAAFLTASAAGLIYRANYLAEQERRASIETQLRETVGSLERLQRSFAAQSDAVQKSIEDERAAAESRRQDRERIINAPEHQDGPVSDVLRCVVSVC